MIERMRRILSLLILMLTATFLAAQGKPYEGPEDPAGDVGAVREGYMNGNRIYLYFQNTTELADWFSGCGTLYSRWPNNLDGVRMLDGVALLVGAQVFIHDDGDPGTTDTEPEENYINVMAFPDNYHTLNYLQTSYREEMDRDITGNINWGFYPVFGYFNPGSEYPAMSNIEDSWPLEGWPSTGWETKWPGEWDGRFGRGVRYADLETYFVVNDAHDLEYLDISDVSVRYYPRPGHTIGEPRTEMYWVEDALATGYDDGVNYINMESDGVGTVWTAENADVVSQPDTVNNSGFAFELTSDGSGAMLRTDLSHFLDDGERYELKFDLKPGNDLSSWFAFVGHSTSEFDGEEDSTLVYVSNADDGPDWQSVSYTFTYDEDDTRFFGVMLDDDSPGGSLYLDNLSIREAPWVTFQQGEPWGGLGLRVEQRGFQWNNPQARDALFWEYTIANISDYDLTRVAFGYWVDNGIGGERDDEYGYFDSQTDLAYSWDDDGEGAAGLPTGTMGFAYLESPGLGFDDLDNDNDGLKDERRDNEAGSLIGPTEGIDNLAAFLEFYSLTEDDLKEHWSGDEDQDWEDGIDTDGDGVYDLSEYAGDDVGLDGVGPFDLNYEGPDEGECDHMPSFQEGVGCEPNFNATDVSESDMVGLTSFQMFPIDSHSQSNDTKWFKNDHIMWDLVAAQELQEFSGNIYSNLVELFASGVFPLYKGRTERISMAELHSDDSSDLLSGEGHPAPALYELKRIVQVIYEKDYRFAQPPKMPTLTATAGDGQVILTWDDVADTRTRDPFVGNINDFEGYKLYRSTDRYFADSEIITDGFGTPTFKKPIFQCDLADDLTGFTDFGLINGMGYYLGDDSGITHQYIDTSVENGRTYYYALVAYDFGAPDIGPGIAPSENNTVIDLDEYEQIRGMGPNVAEVVPHAIAGGYVPPEIIMKDTLLFGTGSIQPEILAHGGLKYGHDYEVTFFTDTVTTGGDSPEPEMNDYFHEAVLYTASGVRVFDATDSVEVYVENPDRFSGTNLVYNDSLLYWSINTERVVGTDVFDGLRLTIDQPYETASFDYSNSGWRIGNGTMYVSPSERESTLMPWDYDIIFLPEDSLFTPTMTNRSNVRDETDTRLSSSILLTQQPVNFMVVNRNLFNEDGTNMIMEMLVHDANNNDTFELFEDRILVGGKGETDSGSMRWGGTVFVIDFFNVTEDDYPEPGDEYFCTFRRPFALSDTLSFSVTYHDSVDVSDLKMKMEAIKVVPNPYIATNEMETALQNATLNQRRKLMFTHIPASCSIKIFTVSGVFVDKIDVENEPDDGKVFWDMLTREGLEIAAGMYIYHVKAHETGDEKMGKFAVIK